MQTKEKMKHFLAYPNASTYALSKARHERYQNLSQMSSAESNRLHKTNNPKSGKKVRGRK